MGILRSEHMRHGTLVIQADQAHDLIHVLGTSATIQFEDMHVHDLQRPYRKHIQRIDEMERIIRLLREEIGRLPSCTLRAISSSSVAAFVHKEATEGPLDLCEVEAELWRLQRDFKQFQESARVLRRSKRVVQEAAAVAKAALAVARGGHSEGGGGRHSFTSGAGSRRSTGEGSFLMEAASFSLSWSEAHEPSQSLMSLAGLVQQKHKAQLFRTLHRSTFGNIYIHEDTEQARLVNEETGAEEFLCIFALVFPRMISQGRSTSALEEKVRGLCAAFGLRTYNWQTTEEAASAEYKKFLRQDCDQRKLLEEVQGYIQQEASRLLTPVSSGGNTLLEEWQLFCAQEKAIYTTMNGFEGGASIRANCWYPASEEGRIQELLVQPSPWRRRPSLVRGEWLGAMLIPDRQQPLHRAPTYVRTNGLTEAVQALVDTYGLPRYREANPALPTLVTFPFLFGIMYGDVGHGLALLAVGVYLVWNDEAIRARAPVLHSARYLVTMMGAFAVYAGVIYSEVFSIGFSLLKPRWKIPSGDDSGLVRMEALFDTRNEGGLGPYPFGVDPSWHGAANELIFLNSLKMKLSMVIGVTHMLFGLLFRCFNAICSCSVLDLVCECVPMILFMLSMFGFMDVMILYKWVTPFEEPPDLINSMICMALPGSEDPRAMFGQELPRKLFLRALLAIPWLLIPKPLAQWGCWVCCQRRRAVRRPRPPLQESHGAEQSLPLQEEEAGDQQEVFDFSETLLHQTIETIEYVLGTVSHVASYLRLWALSLAHQQLSSVFFQYSIGSGMAMPFPLNVVVIYVMFGLWAIITVAILLGMDVLECFLHTLRLHWVEFQSKFYKADGHAFAPLNLHEALKAAIE